MLGADAVAKSAADGYTLLFGTNSYFELKRQLDARLQKLN